MATPSWLQTILGWLGKALTALFAAAVAALGSLVTALAQIGEGAAISEVSQLAWATISLAGLLAFGGILGLTNGRSSR